MGSLNPGIDADPQTAALLNLCTEAIRADVSAELAGSNPVQAAVGFRANIDAGFKPPVLSVYRYERREVQVTMHKWETDQTYRFEYYLPPPPREQLDNRWPLLHLVWSALFKAVCAGKHAAVSSGAGVLQAAGFTYLDPKTIRMVPEFMNDTVPWFRGQMVLRHRDPEDISALQDLLELDASYVLPGATDALVNPIVEEIIDFPP